MKAYLKGAAVGGIAAAFVLVGTSALAGSGIGGIFHLGKTNTVNAKSTLKGSTASKNLQITNTGNGAALGLKVKAGRPPLVVNSGVKVGKLNADKLDGRSSEHFQRAYARTVVVSPRSTAAGSGNALLSAIAGITDASATKRYFVVVEPGVYNVGATMLQMKAFVDVQGAGRHATEIVGSGSTDWFDAVVGGAANTELRDLSVENTGGQTHSVAIVTNDIDPFTVRGVEAVASGSTDNAAILVHGGRASLDDSSFTATGGTNAFGVYLSGGCNYSMDGVDVTASGATTTWGVRLNRCDGNPIANSEIRSTQIGIKGDSSCGLRCNGAGGTTRITNSIVHGTTNTLESPCCYPMSAAASMLSGGPVSSPFSACVYVWDENFATAGDTTCPS